MSGDTIQNLSFSGTELLSKSSAASKIEEINEVAFVFASASVITDPPLLPLTHPEERAPRTASCKRWSSTFLARASPNSFE